MLYGYLKQFDGIVGSHTSATGMGTDWRDNDPNAEPVVEIYQGLRNNYEMPGAPRANSLEDSIGGWRPKGLSIWRWTKVTGWGLRRVPITFRPT